MKTTKDSSKGPLQLHLRHVTLLETTSTWRDRVSDDDGENLE